MSTTETLIDAHSPETDPRANNAVKFGLFSTRDLVLADEQAEYTETRSALNARLLPDGPLEQAFFDEIMSAQWRLRRCGLIEASLVHFIIQDEFGLPILNAEGEKRQKSADRARSQAQISIRRAMNELRKLQTERMTKVDIGQEETQFALLDTGAALRAMKTNEQIKAMQLKAMLQGPGPGPMPGLADLFCKTSSASAASAELHLRKEAA